MSEVIEDEVIETVTDGDLLTLNQLTKILGGHPNTIKKYLDMYEQSGAVKVGEVTRKNRKFKAYHTTNKLLAELQHILQEIRKSSTPIKLSESLALNLFEKDDKKGSLDILNSTVSTEPMKSLDNVKFYEVVKQNNELENKVRMLQAQYKDLEVAKAQEVTTLKAEQTKTEAELYKTQADLKLITDKSSTMESAYAEQKLEVERLNKVVKNRNTALILLGAILLIILTVAVTLTFIR